MSAANLNRLMYMTGTSVAGSLIDIGWETADMNVVAHLVERSVRDSLSSYVKNGQLTSYKLGRTSTIVDWVMTKHGDLKFLHRYLGQGSAEGTLEWIIPKSSKAKRLRPRRKLRLLAKHMVGTMKVNMTFNPAMPANSINVSFVVKENRADFGTVMEGA